MEYFLIIEGQTTGPMGGFEVVSRIHEGLLRGEELGWRKGMAEWQPLRSMEDFAREWPITPEEIAAAEEARALARHSLDTPQPWLRFWARMLDYGWFTTVLCLLLAISLPQSAAKYLTGPGGLTGSTEGIPGVSVLWWSLFIFLYTPFEAYCLSRYGATPGKALLRVQVRTLTGRLPSFGQALKRSIIVYVKGVGLGLPDFNFIMMGLAWMRLPLKQTTEWDAATGLRVEHGEPEAWRYGIVLLAAVLMLVATRLAETLLLSVAKGQS